jgi:threonine dehydratase
MLVEPTGCLGLAAVRERAAQLQGQRVGVVISGGNVDLAQFCALVGSAQEESS